MRIRPAAAAGSFYPADPNELAATVDRLLDAVPMVAGPRPAALIVPHAGYRYSGPIAASGYAVLRRAAADLRRVLLLGPAHFVPLSGMAQSDADAWVTPLGEVPVERASGLTGSAEAHAREHALEVQLPFLQRALPDAVAMPLAVGTSQPEEVADEIARLASSDTLIVVSTDLSHYQDADTARRLDRRTADAIVRADPAAIQPADDCGASPLRGLLAWCARHAYQITELDLRTSADTAGSRLRVVGYGAFRCDRRS